MFAPFTAAKEGVADSTTVHWGNVDTGAMVNVVYLGVTRVFKELQRYWVDFNHALTGVGGKRTRIVAKLKDVPLSLGEQHLEADVVHSTFYVIDNDDYHWILGLPLLAAIRGKVLCKDRALEYTTPQAALRQLPLISRTEAREQPVRAVFRLKSPHLEAE